MKTSDPQIPMTMKSRASAFRLDFGFCSENLNSEIRQGGSHEVNPIIADRDGFRHRSIRMKNEISEEEDQRSPELQLDSDPKKLESKDRERFPEESKNRERFGWRKCKKVKA